MSHALPTLALFSSIGPLEIGVILFVGLLLFGRRLPEVGRGLGKSITEFKRGLKDVTEDVDEAATQVRELDKAEKRSMPTASTVGGGETQPVQTRSGEVSP